MGEAIRRWLGRGVMTVASCTGTAAQTPRKPGRDHDLDSTTSSTSSTTTTTLPATTTTTTEDSEFCRTLYDARLAAADFDLAGGRFNLALPNVEEGPD